jgi:hypothetical protein
MLVLELRERDIRAARVVEELVAHVADEANLPARLDGRRRRRGLRQRGAGEQQPREQSGQSFGHRRILRGPAPRSLYSPVAPIGTGPTMTQQVTVVAQLRAAPGKGDALAGGC